LTSLATLRQKEFASFWEETLQSLSGRGQLVAPFLLATFPRKSTLRKNDPERGRQDQWSESYQRDGAQGGERGKGTVKFFIIEKQ